MPFVFELFSNLSSYAGHASWLDLHSQSACNVNGAERAQRRHQALCTCSNGLAGFHLHFGIRSSSSSRYGRCRVTKYFTAPRESWFTFAFSLIDVWNLVYFAVWFIVPIRGDSTKNSRCFRGKHASTWRHFQICLFAAYLAFLREVLSCHKTSICVISLR